MNLFTFFIQFAIGLLHIYLMKYASGPEFYFVANICHLVTTKKGLRLIQSMFWGGELQKAANF
jgi:hypothetical protein